MNYKKLKSQWFPIFKKSSLKSNIVAKELLGVKLIFFKSGDEVVCFEDNCPHRNVPLSLGSIVDGELRCNYHGWIFGKNGKVKNVKCNSSLRKIDVKVCLDIVWVRLEGDERFYDFLAPVDGYDERIDFKLIKADFIHSIENFLDPMHTPYVHKFILRGSSNQSMSISQEKMPNGFKTIYHLKQKQNGLINRLFDSGIDINIASFYYPGFAKIDYLKKDELLFSVGIFFVPIKKGKVSMIVKVGIKKSKIPSCLKFMLLRPFLEILFYQDKKILQIQYNSQSQTSNQAYEIVQTDLVIEHLLYLYGIGKEAPCKEMELELFN